MARDSYKIEVDGREYLIPDDLDLNDGILLDKMDESVTYMEQMRWIVWRLLLPDNPDMTEEEAGRRVKFAAFMDEAVEEGPPPVPLSEPDPRSGTSSDECSGNGSTGTSDVEVTHVPGGPPSWPTGSE